MRHICHCYDIKLLHLGTGKECTFAVTLSISGNEKHTTIHRPKKPTNMVYLYYYKQQVQMYMLR